MGGSAQTSSRASDPARSRARDDAEPSATSNGAAPVVVELPDDDPVARICDRHAALAALWRWRVPLVVALATVLGLVIAVRSRPAVLYDDAAVTLRYAARIADGQGWTYNPGDRTNGSSAPLYTMALALFDVVGVNLVTAARLIGTAAFAASFGLVAYLGTRIVGIGAGILATGILASWVDFHTQALGGTEAALAAALGLGAIAALREEREVLAAVLLGLALVNNVDAGLLVVAVAIAHAVVLRRPPWRLVGIAAAVAAPWFVFATLSFGSPLPRSLTQRLSGSPAVPDTDVPVSWMLDSIRDQQMLLALVLGLAGLAIVPWVRQRSPRAATALTAVVAWAILHGLAYSVVDLGEPSPWYPAVLYPCLAVGAGCLLGAAVAAARRSSGLALATVGLAIACVAALAVGLHRPDGGAPVEVAETLARGQTMSEYEGFENTRREAARQLAEIAEPGDVIRTCFGWFGFEVPQAVIDDPCGLTTRDPVGPARWLTTIDFPGFDEPELEPGARLAITIGSDVGRGGRTDVQELDVGDG